MILLQNHRTKIIQFVGVDTGTDGDGSRVVFNVADALEHIQPLPFIDGVGGRYMPLKDGSVIHADLYNISPDGVASFTIRHTNRYSWPRMEDKGAVSNLVDGFCSILLGNFTIFP